MVNIISTNTVLTERRKVNILVYGAPGTRKTLSIATLPNPIIISSEQGLLTLREYDIPVIEVKSVAEVFEALEYVEKSDYDSVAIDSLSEIASFILDEAVENITAKAVSKVQGKTGRKVDADEVDINGMAPYNDLLKVGTKLSRRIRDLPQHVYAICRATKTQVQEGGPKKWYPLFPGQKLGDAMCHDFSIILAAREITVEGKNYYCFQAQSDTEWAARDRSGALGNVDKNGKFNPMEKQDLSAIIDKILGVVKQ